MLTQNSKLTEVTPVEYPERRFHLLANLHYGYGERICALINYNCASILDQRGYGSLSNTRKKNWLYLTMYFSLKIKDENGYLVKRMHTFRNDLSINLPFLLCLLCLYNHVENDHNPM